MPEGDTVLNATDDLVRNLCPNGKWMILVNAFKCSDSFNQVNLNLLVPALNQPIVDLFCKGKEYFLVLGNGVSIRAHCGMAGHWSMVHSNAANFNANTQIQFPSSTHFRFDFSNDDNTKFLTLLFVNERFGEFEIFSTIQQLQTSVDRIASSFIGRYILTLEEWRINFNSFTDRKSLRAAMLDQKELCSGIGNFLLAEIMYYAKLHPDATIGTVKAIPNGIDNLYHLCKTVVEGFYTGRLDKIIYNKKECIRGHPVSHSKKGGRTAWYCNTCLM